MKNHVKINTTKGMIEWNVERSSANPIIKRGMPGLRDEQVSNINGPSVIRVPKWVPNPLGRYYLYFASHNGQSIRLAYADSLHGQWTIYKPGTLRLEQTVAYDHIASPDVHVDEEKKRIRMYFHGCYPHRFGQVSFVALSKDGINFKSRKEVLGWFYFRVFRYDGWYYAIAKKENKSGVIMCSKDGLKQFKEEREIIPRMRHAAVTIENDCPLVFYSRCGDDPERILVSEMHLSGDKVTSEPVEVLRSEMDYEGVNIPNRPSQWGDATAPVHELRDPYIFKDESEIYLFYTVAGEGGIGLAELKPKYRA